jgi:hypothetical protein
LIRRKAIEENENIGWLWLIKKENFKISDEKEEENGMKWSIGNQTSKIRGTRKSNIFFEELVSIINKFSPIDDLLEGKNVNVSFGNGMNN